MLLKHAPSSLYYKIYLSLQFDSVNDIILRCIQTTLLRSQASIAFSLRCNSTVGCQ